MVCCQVQLALKDERFITNLIALRSSAVDEEDRDGPGTFFQSGLSPKCSDWKNRQRNTEAAMLITAFGHPFFDWVLEFVREFQS